MKRIFLHIGNPKTGTTAIQRFLHENTGTLAAAGLLVPRTGLAGGVHSMFSQALGVPSMLNPATMPDAQTLRRDLFAEITAHPAEKIIISSEFFAAAQHLGPVLKFFTEPGFEVKILIYLRRHDYMFESMFAQFERMVQTNPGWDFDINSYTLYQLCRTPEMFEYLATLRRWQSVFGANAVIVRPYEAAQNQPDIFADFLAAMGVTESLRFTRPEIVHPSLTQETLYAARKIRAAGLPDEIKRKMLKAVFETDTATKGQRFFSPAMRHIVVQKYAASYKTIAQDFLGRADGRLFLEPAPTPADKPVNAGRPDPEIVMEKLVKAALGLVEAPEMEFPAEWLAALTKAG